MKSSILLAFSFILLLCCNSLNENNDELVLNYIYENLDIPRKVNEKQYFLILNPNYPCIGCYVKSYQKIQNYMENENIYIIADASVNQWLGGSQSENLTIVDDPKFFEIGDSENLPNRFYIIENSKILKKVLITPSTIDTIDFLIINNRKPSKIE